jgi:2-hydroxy-3-keto-5-methylthiopentenyl-1-phosphate phosphatase
VERLLIAVDFDGTITVRDTLHVIVERYGTPGVWERIEPRLRAGEITLEDAMEEEFAGVSATFEEVRALVLRDAPVRVGFAELVAWAAAEDHALVVVSAGFRSVIDAVLGEAGLTGLDVRANDAVFTPGGTTLRWAERGERCARCERRCKRHDLAIRMVDGQSLVYVGDGLSDSCAARMGEIVFARGGLAADLAGDGVAHVVFDDFHDVLSRLRELPAAA